jgi:hypothetical protein
VTAPDFAEVFDRAAATYDAAAFPFFTPQHEMEFVFRDEQAWWDWNWSHGSRAFLEPLPEEVRHRCRAEVAEAMEHIRGESGFPRTYTALFSLADR